MKKYAIIVRGGEGNRACGVVPKQFHSIGGIPMLWWSVRAFHREDPATKVIIVMHPGFFDDWDIMHSELPEEDRRIETIIVCGGRTRCESVMNGLNSVNDGEDVYVAVHDAARPLVNVDMISAGWKAAATYKAVIPAVPIDDSIRKVDGDENWSVPRKDYVKVQTPQVFEAGLLREAYANVDTTMMTDDASVVEAFGHKVMIYPGSTRNFKVTNPEDIQIASMLIKETYLDR